MSQSRAAGPAAATDRLLFLMVALQEREHRTLTEALHDGPMQDLTGILLSLASLRRGLPEDAAGRIADIETRLRDAAATLHRPPPPFRPGNSPRQMLELGLTQRVEGVLVERLHISLDIDTAPPLIGEVAVLLSTVQLLLQESDPIHLAARALVAVRSRPDAIDLALRVAYAGVVRPYPPGLASDPAPIAGTSDSAPSGQTPPVARETVGGWLERLEPVAALLGATLRADPDTGAWSAAVRLPRQNSRPARPQHADQPRTSEQPRTPEPTRSAERPRPTDRPGLSGTS